MKTASLAVLLAVCACTQAAPATTASHAAPSPPAAPALAAGALPAEDVTAPAARDKKSAPGTCITVAEPGKAPLTLCNETPAPDAPNAGDGGAAAARTHDLGHHHAIKVPLVKHVKVPVVSHGYDPHGYGSHAFGDHHRSADAIGSSQQRFAYSYAPFGAPAFGDFRASEADQQALAAAFNAQMAQMMNQQALEQARQAQAMDQMNPEQARQFLNQQTFEQARQVDFEQAQQMNAQALEQAMVASARSALQTASYASLPAVNNYLPSLPAAATGVFLQAAGGGGGCGALPLMFSCSPQLVRGHMVGGGGAASYGGGSVSYGGGAAAYGGGAVPYGGGAVPYGGGAVPYGSGAVPYGGGAVPYGGGAAYRQIEEDAAASLPAPTPAQNMRKSEESSAAAAGAADPSAARMNFQSASNVGPWKR